ncbi:hypothetical protein C8T65DRAFT_740286 [Cerioporus squamosus]|nr:hypothetical protein C8T65DRAFT_740286 [Cerioporus squamosus]
MGATRLRDDEADFIEAMRVSAEIRSINNGTHGAMTRAARRVEELYLQQFSGHLPGETEAEFIERRKNKKSARRLTAESDEERQERLKKIGEVSNFSGHSRAAIQRKYQRILGIFKRHSINFSRRKKSAAGDDENTSSPPAPLAANSNPYREFQQSQHPTKPKMPYDSATPRNEVMRKYNQELKQAFDHLPATDLAQFTAQAEAKRAIYESDPQREIRRAKHAEEMPHVVERTQQTWQRQSGWVGMCVLGGLDEHGELVGTFPSTGKDRFGLTFEERLAREFGTSTTYIRLTFSKWLGDIFDAPVPPEGAHVADVARHSVPFRGPNPPVPTMQPARAGEQPLPLSAEAGGGGSKDIPERKTPLVDMDDNNPVFQQTILPSPHPAFTPAASPSPPSLTLHAHDHGGGSGPTLPEERTSHPPNSLASAEPDADSAAVPLARNGTSPSPPRAPELDASDSEFDTDRDLPGSVSQMVASLGRPRVALVPPLRACSPRKSPPAQSHAKRAPKPSKGTGAPTQPEPKSGDETVVPNQEPAKRIGGRQSHNNKSQQENKVPDPPQAAENMVTKPRKTAPKPKKAAVAKSSKKVQTRVNAQTPAAKPKGEPAKLKPTRHDPPVVTRTGRISKRTARITGDSPDMCAAKYLHDGKNRGKRKDRDEGLADDTQRSKKRR